MAAARAPSGSTLSNMLDISATSCVANVARVGRGGLVEFYRLDRARLRNHSCRFCKLWGRDVGYKCVHHNHVPAIDAGNHYDWDRGRTKYRPEAIRYGHRDIAVRGPFVPSA
jgi:hypothetical protein